MADETPGKPDAQEQGKAQDKTRRKIPGGLPYTSSPGVLRRVLEKVPISEKPSVFTNDFLATVMGATGGAARPIIPIFKSMGLLNQNGAPTELYGQFQTEGGRPLAALQALRAGFPEIFKRNQYAHKADEAALIDLIVSITGLPKTDPIVRYMLTTFQAFQDHAKSAREDAVSAESESIDARAQPQSQSQSQSSEPPRIETSGRSMGLVYNINVVLPETTNIEVYNSIFRSLKGNLLQ